MTNIQASYEIDRAVEIFVGDIVLRSETTKSAFFAYNDGSGTAELGYCCWGDISYKYQPENATSFNVENGTFALSDSTTVENSIIIDSPHFVVKLGELTQPVVSPLSFSSNYSSSFRYSYFTGSYSYTNSSGLVTTSTSPFLLSSNGGDTFSYTDSRLRYTSQQSYASTITYNYSFPYSSQWFWTGTQFYSSSFTPNAINLNLPSSVSYNVLTEKLIDYYNTLLDPDEEPVTPDDIQPYSHYVPVPVPVPVPMLPDVPQLDLDFDIDVPQLDLDFSFDTSLTAPVDFFVETSNYIYNDYLSLPILSPFLFLAVFVFIIDKFNR